MLDNLLPTMQSPFLPIHFKVVFALVWEIRKVVCRDEKGKEGNISSNVAFFQLSTLQIDWTTVAITSANSYAG